MNSFFLLMIFVSIHVFAEDSRELICNSPGNVVEIGKLDSLASSYVSSFARPVGRDKFVVSSSDQYSNHQNYLCSLETQKCGKIPGLADPDMIGENLLVTPALEENGNNGGMTFYQIDSSKLTADGKFESKKIGADESNQGTYQTVAPSGAPDQFLMLAGGELVQGLNLRTYAKTASGIQPVGGPKIICPERSLSLPMLSPGGDKFSAYDNDRQETIVVDLKTDSKCAHPTTVSRQLLGKLSFSPNGEQIAFHVDALANLALPEGLATRNAFRKTYNKRTFKWEISTIQMNQAFVMDLRGGDPKPIGKGLGHDTRYPIFLADGSLVYGAFTKDGLSFHHVELKPEAQADHPNSKCSTANSPGIGTSLAALGALFTFLCKDENVELLNPASVSGSITTALSLDANNCTSLVKQHWKGLREQVTQNFKKLKKLKSNPPTKARGMEEYYISKEHEVDLDALENLSEADLLAACTRQ